MGLRPPFLSTTNEVRGEILHEACYMDYIWIILMGYMGYDIWDYDIWDYDIWDMIYGI